MNDWIAMTINVGYFWLAVVIVRKLNLKILKDAFWSSIWAEIFLASVFLQIGLLLFDIPVGFFGMNNPYTNAELKERWWIAPGVTSSALLCILSCRSALSSFRANRFGSKEWQLLLLSSFLFSAMMLCLVILSGIKHDGMPPESQQFILDYWWGIGLFFALLHLFLSALIKAACQLFAWKKKMEQQANAPDMDGL